MVQVIQEEGIFAPVARGLQQVSQIKLQQQLQDRLLGQQQDQNALLRDQKKSDAIADQQQQRDAAIANLKLQQQLGLIDSSIDIDRIAGISGPVTPSGVTEAVKAVQKKDEVARKAPDLKPNVIEKKELTNLGDLSGKIDRTISDAERGIELIDSGLKTGPNFFGPVAENVFTTDSQKEFKGIGSRMVVGSVPTLPRIQKEFESLESGNVSLSNPPEVNKRNLSFQLEAAQLVKRTLARMAELQDDEGLSEVEALRQVKREFRKEDEELAKKLAGSRTKSGNKKDGSQLTDAEKRKIIFGE